MPGQTGEVTLLLRYAGVSTECRIPDAAAVTVQSLQQLLKDTAVELVAKSKKNDAADTTVANDADIASIGTVLGITRYVFGPHYPLDVVARYLTSFQNEVYTILTRDIATVEDSNTMEDEEVVYEDLVCDDNERRLRASKVFMDAISKHGFARFALPARYTPIFTKAQDQAEKFFKLDRGEKESCMRHPEKRGFEQHICGWLCETPRKEIFHLHSSVRDDAAVWPEGDQGAPFKAAITALYDTLQEIAIACLHAVAYDAGQDVSVVDALCDNIPFPWQCSTAMRVFNYMRDETEENDTVLDYQCIEHCDTSLFTVAPASPVPELEMVDSTSMQWEWVEEGASVESSSDHLQHVVVFPGSYMSRMLAGGVVTPLHRVWHKQKEARISTPFFLRARHDAVLDPTLFGHRAPGSARSMDKRAVTVKQFLEQIAPTLPRFMRAGADKKVHNKRSHEEVEPGDDSDSSD